MGKISKIQVKHGGRSLIIELESPFLNSNDIIVINDFLKSVNRTHNISEPTVGIITALPHESAAIRAILGDPPRIDVPGSGAGRIYWMAEIPSPRGGLHRVVIAQGGMGTNVASIRASLLLSHFPSVRSIIMCGIAGGIPNPTKPDDHVRLGDIVVSNLKGVVQYDFIKRTVKRKKTDVPEEVRAAPHRPSAELLEAVETLVANEHLGEHPWDRWLEESLGRLGWGAARSRDRCPSR